MKLLTLNVWQGRLERVLLKHLETLDVDIACMQEAVDYGNKYNGLISSYQKVGKSLGLENQFFSPLTTMKLGDRDVVHGNVTYSNVPFSETTTVFTKGSFTENFDFDTEDYNIRAFQHSFIEVDGKKLNVINHHGHHIDAHKLGDEETLRQIQQIVDYIAKLKGAVIVCGDFNLSPESESIQLLDTKLKNLPVKYSLKTTRSQLTHKDEVCDYIFVSDNIVVNAFAMDETIISDHNALVLDFDIK
jgi:endonuclease/exonuclease/phosphatase family metal-dependent hydrolase